MTVLMDEQKYDYIFIAVPPVEVTIPAGDSITFVINPSQIKEKLILLSGTQLDYKDILQRFRRAILLDIRIRSDNTEAFKLELYYANVNPEEVFNEEYKVYEGWGWDGLMNNLYEMFPLEANLGFKLTNLGTVDKTIAVNLYFLAELYKK